MHPDIIDISKFESETLMETFVRQPGAVGKLTLKDPLFNKSIYFDKEKYELYYPLVGFDVGVTETSGGKYEFKYYGTAYTLINREVIVRVRDATGKINNKPIKLETNIIFATEVKEYR